MYLRIKNSNDDHQRRAGPTRRYDSYEPWVLSRDIHAITEYQPMDQKNEHETKYTRFEKKGAGIITTSEWSQSVKILTNKLRTER